MAAGKYRDRITIQQPARSENASGEIEKTWTTYAERWAEVNAVSASESTTDRQTVSETRYSVTLRADPLTRAITSQMRLLHSGQVLQIGGVQRDGVQHVILDCTARVEPT